MLSKVIQMWCKWKHVFSDKCNAKDNWIYLGDDHPSLGESPMESFKTAFERVIKEEHVPVWENEYKWSENYRGVEFEIVETAPDEVIELHLEQCENIVKYSIARMNELRVLLGLKRLRPTEDDTPEIDTPQERMLTQFSMSLASGEASRWALMRKRSPSGKNLFICLQCGRVSVAPDKTCKGGCGDE